MSQQEIWEREYKDKKLVGGDKPAASFRAFCKWLKKERKKAGRIENPGFPFQAMSVLDLGSGEGKNALFIAERGAEVVGVEIAKNAIKNAQESAKRKDRELRVAGGSVEYRWGSIGKKLDVSTESVDVVFDVTSSNALSTEQRKNYLDEVGRVLKTRGYFFVRALCKDGDDNAKELIKKYPGPEPDTYVMPGVGLVERVFTESDFRKTYNQFTILKLEKEFHYTKMNDRSYKRVFWIAYLQK